MEGAFLTIIKGLKHKYRNESGKYFGALLNLYNLCFEEPFVFDGGEGSGNFNHAGRPGLVGGSAKNGEEREEDTNINMKSKKYKEAFERIVNNSSEEVRQKMLRINIDFTKDNILPSMNKEEADYLGIKPLPFLLKLSTIERNMKKHPLTKEKTDILLATALYSPEYIGGDRGDGRLNFITSLWSERNPLVLVDIKENENGYYEIVHYFLLDAKRNNKKRAEKEGRDSPI